MQAEVSQQQTADENWLTEVKVQSLPAIKKEPYSPSLSELLPRIYFTPLNFSFERTKGSMESWQSYGEWQYQLLSGRDQLPPTLKEELQKRTANCNTPYEKIAAIYQYLASTTRYVSIQLGIGGLQPIAAADVNRTGFGDCKGLSNYMRAMLTELGIPSVYTVISTTNRRLLADFASANQNNHVILQVPLPNDTLWLECTNPTLPLGYVHHSIAGHDALLVGPNGGTLCQLPTYADSLNTQVNNTLVTLQPDGSAKVEVKQTSRLFQYEDMASIIDMEPARQKDWLRSDINLVQAKVDAILKNIIVFGLAPAGTGKTYLAMAMAITAFKNNEVSRIILTRPAIEAGEKLGFLPGDLQSKVDPYLRPLYDALYQIMGADSFQKNMEKGLIEVAPLAYMRGRTLDNAYIILDEAQNTTPAQMKMFLTRIGFGSKVIVTGDSSQKDLPVGAKSGLDVAARVLKNIDDIAFCTLTSKDVVRHPLVQKIVEAYDAYEKKDADASRGFRRNSSGTRDRKDGGRKNR